MLETKNSRCWESVVELCLKYCDIETIYKIVSETCLPNLRHLHLDNFCSRYEDDKYTWSGEKNHSLRQLSLQFSNNVYGDKLLGILFKCFPNMIEFRMHSGRNASIDYIVAALPKGLRVLNISAMGNFVGLNFLNHLARFPLLTKLKLKDDFSGYQNLDLKESVYLPNLTKLVTHQWIFNSASFVLPELRELTLDFVYDSSLDNLKESKKLKDIQVGNALKGIMKKDN